MKFDLQYIRTGELENYVHSEEYSKHNFVAISKSRAISHANNPRADKEDIALILAYHKEKLIGYLGIIPEHIFKGNEAIKVCWLSCMWVLPDYRRTGIATHLLSDAFKLYKGLVLITNYIPRSKAAFFKTGHYIEIVKLNGVRAYLRFDMATILPRKNRKLTWISPLLRTMDACLNALLHFQTLITSKQKELQYRYESIITIDDATGKFINSISTDNPFHRSRLEFEWIQKFPWVSDSKNSALDYKKYYFSQYSADFKQWFVRILDPGKGIIGFLLLTRHKNELKTHYILSREDMLPDIFRFIHKLMAKEKIPTLVCHHQGLADQITRNKKQFLMVRPSEYGFIATNEIKELLENQFGKLYDGDGDGVFT